MIWSTVSDIWGKHTEIGNFRSFFALLPPSKTPKITIILFKVPEIQSETDKSFCHSGPFGPFFPLLPPIPPLSNDPKNQNFGKKKEKKGNKWLELNVYHKWRSYDIWFLKYKVQQTEIFLSFWAIFLPFQPPDNLDNKNFKIEKNTWR